VFEGDDGFFGIFRWLSHGVSFVGQDGILRADWQSALG